jgi:hypothetical protein
MGDGRGRLVSCLVPSSSSSSTWPCPRLLTTHVSLSSSQGGIERHVGERIWASERIFGVAVVHRGSVLRSISIYDVTFLLQSRTEDVRIHSCVFRTFIIVVAKKKDAN